ncbi:inorganic phosphate transporter [soil metagenome]
MGFWDAALSLDTLTFIAFGIALLVAFGFEFINGFHDTANAVTTVIYTRSLSPTPAVIYSGFMNFLGAFLTVLGGAGVAFGIVNLLPVDLLADAKSTAALISVLALLLSGVIWNLSTWYIGLPVSSSHTLIGSIIGVGLMNSLIMGNGLQGINWDKVKDTALALLCSPLIGFVAAAILLLFMKRIARNPKLYTPPVGDEHPPGWIRAVLIATCGGVSFAHGSNDGQKGMGLLLLVLIGFLPNHYALNTYDPETATQVISNLDELAKLKLPVTSKSPDPAADVKYLQDKLVGKTSFTQVEQDERWEVRKRLFRITQSLKSDKADIPAKEKKVLLASMNNSIEFVPLWVIIGTALALGIGTTIGYKRIVITVAEKIGKTHLTYGQGAAAETVTAATIFLADYLHAPVSTTQILSSGIAGTMAANRNGVQMNTARKILLAWILTLPCTMILAGILYWLGRTLFV